MTALTSRAVIYVWDSLWFVSRLVVERLGGTSNPAMHEWINPVD